MMDSSFQGAFDAMAAPTVDDPDKPLYAAVSVPDHQNYFIAKDVDARACFLVVTGERSKTLQPPIRLESLDVQFELHCHVRKYQEPEREGTFTVIRCRSLDRETIRYFFSICDTILRMVGDAPTRSQLFAAINRLAAIFQTIQRPPARPVNGLFGELYLIWRSRNPVRALTAWRTDDNARFDFSDGDIRLDVKAASGKVRVHQFSYEQCNPPLHTAAVVASVLVTRASGGVNLRSVISEIEARVAANADLVLKLHEVVASTLGTTLSEALQLQFDTRLAESSLKFFDLRTVPAIRGQLPTGVSEVHFRSDLSALPALSVSELIDRDYLFSDLLPAAHPA
jgi:hypothetical protein